MGALRGNLKTIFGAFKKFQPTTKSAAQSDAPTAPTAPLQAAVAGQAGIQQAGGEGMLSRRRGRGANILAGKTEEKKKMLGG